MSLTRKMLKAYGIEDQIIEQIIEAHTETTDSLKAERDRYKEEADKVEELRKQLLEASNDTELTDLQAKYDAQTKELEDARAESAKVQAEYDGYKAEVEAKGERDAKEAAFRKLLADANVSQKYVDVIVRATRFDDMKLGEDGKLVDEEKLSDGIKSDWSEFITTTKVKKADPEDPPKQDNVPQGVSDIARQVNKEHHERLFGKSEE